MNYVFKTIDHPDTTGIEGGEYDLHVKTDEGGTLTIHMGRQGFIEFAAAMLCILADSSELHAETVEMSAKIKLTT